MKVDTTNNINTSFDDAKPSTTIRDHGEIPPVEITDILTQLNKYYSDNDLSYNFESGKLMSLTDKKLISVLKGVQLIFLQQIKDANPSISAEKKIFLKEFFYAINKQYDALGAFNFKINTKKNLAVLLGFIFNSMNNL